MRTVISLLIVLFLVSTLNITTSFAQEPRQYQILEHPADIIWDFEYSPDNATLATGSSDGKVRLWDVATGTIRYTLEHPNVGEVYDVAFSPDSSILASTNDDWKVRLWDVETGTIRRTIVGHNGPVWSVAYSSDGKMIASSSNDATRTWDAATGTPLHTLPRGRARGGNASALTFSPDNTTLLQYSDRDRHMLLWDVTTGTLRHTFDALSGILDVAYSPDGATFAATFGTNDMVRLWNVVTGTLVHRLEHSDITFDVVYSSNSRTLISSGSDGVRVWDVATGTLIDVLPGAGQYVAYSPDGKVLASHGHTAHALRLWDATTYLPIRTITGPGGGRAAGFKGNKISYSPDGTTLASRGSGGVVLWRFAPPPPPIIFTPSEVTNQTFSVGTPVSLALPFATGGTDPYTYTLAPLPNGLQFDATTRELYGTPLTPLNATPVTYTATDATGQTASLTFNITVTGAPATGITFSPGEVADQTFVVNEPIALLSLPLATGGVEPYTYTLDPVPAGLFFDAAIQALSGTPTTVGTTTATYTAVDATGAYGSLTFTIDVTGDAPSNLDVNRDGRVDVLDLVWVAVSYGMRGPTLPADVNADGVVNVQDLVAVAAGIDAAATLPAKIAEEVLLAAEAAAMELEGAAGAPVMEFNTYPQVASNITAYGNVAAALSDAKHLATGDVRLGKWLPLLEELLQVLAEMGAIPETTALLSNYPNPFNPETWIPYHLAQDADVRVTIYNMRGAVVRELLLGYQAAGVYQSRGRAAYWDGRNQLGEPVASGVYFYTLTAGGFSATRKLLIAK